MRSAGGGGGPAVSARTPSEEALGRNGSTPMNEEQSQPIFENEGPRRRSKKKRQERKAVLQVASLNINGYGNLIRDHKDNKWGRLYRMMSEHKIGILLLQETHLTDERKAAIHKMFARRIKVFHSPHPESPTQKEGVAIVLNSRYVNTTDASATEVIPGRAIQISLACQGGDTRNILCIYAPTSAGVAERVRFYKDLAKYYEDRPNFPRPHLMAGDFNNIEDTIDRLPIGDGPDASTIALDELKMCLGLMLADGWRVTNPNRRDYTFHRGTGRNAVFSRLDRIYVTASIFENAREWRTCEAGVLTDHSLVLVQLTPEHATIVGQGRPVFPLTLMKDKPLTKKIKDRGMEAMRELVRFRESGIRTEEVNPQRILHALKRDIMKLARAREREVVPKLLAEIKELEHALRAVKAQRSMPEPEKVAEAEALTKQIRQLRLQRYKQQQLRSRATHRLYGERPTKYWSKLHKPCTPRDIIQSFEREDRRGVAGEKIYESDSVRMAEMARTHHMNVQRDDSDIKPADEREIDIEKALTSLEARVTDVQAEALGHAITYEECVLSLRLSKCGSAPGLDGFPFELWKALHARHIEDSRHPDREDFDIVSLFQETFEDVRLHGVSPHTSFARGWIAPIYKEKGERTRVVNYRPITLLNTDYKLLSKTLAVRLADVAPSIIHRAQAGFVPGRRIHNHTQLARMMVLWAEENEADGAIVALDQEKAYDRIAHDYLWRVLETLHIPPSFIKMIKSLYASAETEVMVNGILSRAYRIYRGVRQGDPLSCLLFDLAIEPLSAMIRNSDIEGFDIPRCNETLKAVLFADDTTVYLSSRDDFKTLQDVLDTWCSAAKARFNINKTEIIPIGSTAHREEMASTYQRTGTWKNYPRGVHVAQEGEAVRILGAFFGNGIDQVNVWTLVLNKIVAMRPPLMQVIARWKTGHATVRGKKHVAQMIVGGITQYLTAVQRMPDAIRQRLVKIVRGYLWDDRRNTPVGMQHVYLPVEQGGLGMIDLETRNEAIDIMWLKTYLDFSDERPLWAYLADDLLASHVTKDCRPRSHNLRLNPFLQRWKPRVYGIPEELQGMMDAAKKYGVRLEGLAFSKRILNSMPMWDHTMADRTRLGRLTVPSRLLTCLQESHKAKTVGDFVELARIADDAGHLPKVTCRCPNCARVRTATGCTNPHLCGTRAGEIISTLPDRWNPRKRQPEDYEERNMGMIREENLNDELTPFNRCVTTHGDVGHAIRIFTDKEPTCDEAIPMEIEEDGTRLTIATDGSCTNNGEKGARAGAGVFVESNPVQNQSLRLPDWIDQSNQTAEIVATFLATTTAGNRTRVIHETDSQTTMDSLTRRLQKHEDTGYIMQKNAVLTRATIAKLRMRQAHTVFRWIKAHNGHQRNEAADALAALGAAGTTGGQLSLAIPAAFKLSGAKLQSMTQKLAYRAIRGRKDALTKPRPIASSNMAKIADGIEDAFGVQLHDATIWKSLRGRHVSREASQFMWMAIHDGYMVGTHWLRPSMPIEKQQRAICLTCGERESMTHILLECKANGQNAIWRLLERTWSLTGMEWYQPSWGSILGAGCAVFKSEAGSRKTATESLWCILCTEAVHLVWKLRCERVIQREGKEFSEEEVKNRFYATMNSRLNLDRRTAAKARGKRALKPSEVDRIWRPILENSGSLPVKWVVDYGVLVGIERGR